MILIAFGTRPEIIKLFPIIRALQAKNIPFKTLFTGQHTDLYEDVKNLIPTPDYTFEQLFSGEEKHNTLSNSFIKICSATEALFQLHRFKTIVVQGDTTTAWALALIGFYNKIQVAHVEAGLRTFDMDNPFPEEANRALIGQVATLNFAPTRQAADNLRTAGAKNIHLVGNTIVDAVRLIKQEHALDDTCQDNSVLVTLHRRENHAVMADLFDEINKAAHHFPELQFIWPLHPNPNVQKHRARLTAINISVIEPLPYLDTLKLINRSKFLITDSGGIQEEASCFNKRVLIARETTERAEILEIGLGKLIGTNIFENIPWALKPTAPLDESPFGDGHTAEKITAVITSNA